MTRLVLAFCAVGVVGFAAGCEEPQPSAGRRIASVQSQYEAFDRVQKQHAWQMAEHAVKSRLPAPHTAKFVSSSGERQDPQTCVTISDDGEYLVMGWVESLSEVGALVRADFKVRLTMPVVDNWELAGEPELVARE